MRDERRYLQHLEDRKFLEFFGINKADRANIVGIKQELSARKPATERVCLRTKKELDEETI